MKVANYKDQLIWKHIVYSCFIQIFFSVRKTVSMLCPNGKLKIYSSVFMASLLNTTSWDTWSQLHFENWYSVGISTRAWQVHHKMNRPAWSYFTSNPRMSHWTFFTDGYLEVMNIELGSRKQNVSNKYLQQVRVWTISELIKSSPANLFDKRIRKILRYKKE